MSVGTGQVAVLGTRGRITAPRAHTGSARSLTRVTTFGLLALYGTLKWSTLVTGHPLSRLLGLLVLALLLVAGRPALARRSRVLAAVATFLVLIAAFPMAGVPLAWILHVRVAVTARAIGQGLSALPQVLVPYSGVNHRIDLVMTLGAAVLLFDGALLVAFAHGPMNNLRRAGAALPLVALAAVPSTLVRPALPYVDGAILFALLVAFMWGEEIGQRQAAGALGLGLVAVIAGLFVAPALDRHKPWFDYRALGGGTAVRYVDGFDWTQGYGKIDWPRSGRLVLEVKAPQPEYWKAENLDVFNGVGWADGPVVGPTPSPDASAAARWTQKIQVTIANMQTSDVIGAGTTIGLPVEAPESLSPGTSPGTWTTAIALRPGDTYEEAVYNPDPSSSELAAAGSDYSGLAPGYRAIDLPPTSGTPSPDENYFPEETSKGDKAVRGYQPQLVFPPFHSGQPIASTGGPAGASGSVLIDRSQPYAPIYRLAQTLAAGAATPYQFVTAVESYLAHGFTYNESPPASSYPLATFLLSSHLGYCQQFAGAMALLLRMGGVPARVAVGFTPGRKDPTTGLWLVTDYDAHAWVEAWFPHYGWVRFDPTPPVDPALSNHTPIPGSTGTNVAGTGFALSASKTAHGASSGRRRRITSQAGGASHKRGAAAGSAAAWITAAGVALLALVLIGVATKPLRSVEALVAELEVASRRVGRPLPGGATLTWLERRMEGSDDARAYVRALRLARFRGADRLPTTGQRRALRRQLRRGLGPLGVARSIWALPPRWGGAAPRGGRGPSRSQTRTPHTPAP